MMSAPGLALAALMASRRDSLPSAGLTTSRLVVTRNMAGSARPSRHSRPGRKRRRECRSAVRGGVATTEASRARSFFNMTRSFTSGSKVAGLWLVTGTAVPTGGTRLLLLEGADVDDLAAVAVAVAGPADTALVRGRGVGV